MRSASTPPHPASSLRSEADLSPQAGRGKNARACPSPPLAPLGRDRRAVERCREDRRPAAEIPAPGGLCRPRSIRSTRGARQCWASAPGPRSPRCRKCPSTSISWRRPKRGRRGRGMRAAGVKVATVLADGFAEAGAEGPRARRGCATSARSTGIRIVGPSSLGVVDLRDKVLLTANAAFDEAELPVGRIFAASHSGSMIGALVSRGKARGIGFAGLVSVGNEVDLSIGEICAATLDDPGIDGYMLFLETMRHADALRGFALAAAARGKPVRRLQARPLGGGARACGLAYRRARRRGRRRRRLPRRLRHRARRYARRPDRGAAAASRACRPRGRRAAAAGRRGDHDRRRRHHGGRSARARAASRSSRRAPRRSRASTPPASTVEPARLVDLTIAGTRYDVMKAALDILLAAPEFDLVLAVVGSSARFHPELAVQADHRLRRRSEADRGVPGARGAAGARGAGRGRRAELPHAGSLRRRHRRGVAAAGAAADGRRARCPRIAAARPAARRARSLRAARPARHRRARRRSRSMPISRTRRRCRSPIRSRSRRCPPRSRTSPISAASCSTWPMATPLLAAIRQISGRVAEQRPAPASIACWCSRWSRAWARF